MNSIAADSKKGYFLEVDLEYPIDLHDSHNAFPLAPESLVIPKECMSPDQLELLGDRPAPKVKKLGQNLVNKTKYVLHCRNIQLYLQLGMKLTKNYRVLKFDQEPWMRSYTDLNTNLRKNAKSDFEKDLYKLMNNSVFGKTMENVRNRKDIELLRCTSKKERNKICKLTASPCFAEAKIVNENVAAIHMYKTKVKLNRPINVGIATLDLAKYLCAISIIIISKPSTKIDASYYMYTPIRIVYY